MTCSICGDGHGRHVCRRCREESYCAERCGAANCGHRRVRVNAGWREGKQERAAGLVPGQATHRSVPWNEASHKTRAAESKGEIACQRAALETPTADPRRIAEIASRNLKQRVSVAAAKRALDGLRWLLRESPSVTSRLQIEDRDIQRAAWREWKTTKDLRSALEIGEIEIEVQGGRRRTACTLDRGSGLTEEQRARDVPDPWFVGVELGYGAGEHQSLRRTIDEEVRRAAELLPPEEVPRVVGARLSVSRSALDYDGGRDLAGRNSLARFARGRT